MTSIKYSLLCCAVLSVAGVVQLRAQDRKGCKASPYIITAHHGTTWFYLKVHEGNNGMVFIYDETFVTEKQMTQEVTANAATLSSELTATGHTLVPGIYFDTGKAGVKPESDASLKEVAKVLQQNPALRLYVVGHTDNVGTLTSNVSS